MGGWKVQQKGTFIQMTKIAIGFVACLLLNGCTSIVPLSSLLSSPSKGTPPLQVHEQTSVELAEANFHLVRTNVVGQSKGFSLLGIVTIYPATLTKAMGRLYGNAQMNEGTPQTVCHLVIEQSSTYWILFGIPQVTVRADIVQFNPAEGREKTKAVRRRSDVTQDSEEE